MDLVKRMIPWLAPYKRKVALVILTGILTVSVNVLVPLQTSRAIDEGIVPGDQGVVVTTVVRMVLIVLAGMALQITSVLLGLRISFGFAHDLRRDLHQKVQRLSFSNLDTLTSGELIVRLTSDISKVQQIVGMGFAFLLQAPLVLIAALFAMVSLRPDLATVLLVISPIVVIVTMTITIKSRSMFTEVQGRLDRLNTVLRENLAGARVVKAFVREQHESERFGDVNGSVREKATEVNQLVALLAPALLGMINLGSVAVLWFGGLQVIGGGLTSGEFVAFLNYLAMAAMPLMVFAMVQPMLAAAAASSHRILEVIDAEPGVTPAPAVGADTPRPDDFSGHVRFEDVAFGYADDDVVLDGVDLDIPAGTTVAVLGATGSGKTTLVALLARFYDVDRGRVTIDGHDVRDIPNQVLRRVVAVSLQRAQLFSGTLGANIRFGAPTATDDDVRAAAAAADAAGFIEDKFDGYDAIVEQGGGNLSGGQRQRMAIARALIADAPVLILDDSTSAVDIETEARIQDALRERRAGQTTILVAQRISTALAADRIILLDGGRVCAYGTHEHLLAESRLYREILQSQLGTLQADDLEVAS